MQRPTPLPAPPATRPAAAAPTRPAAAPPERRTPGDEELAPPLPLPGAETGTPGIETPGSAASDESPVRLRDVWRASRARRRALHAEVRRFTGRARRRRLIWLGVAASLVLLVVGSLAAAYSPLLAVERITVVGADRLDTATVERAVSSQLGKPLPLVDESAVKEALVAFPLVESYSLEAIPPHDLVLRIVERTPVGVISSRAGYTLVDAAGVALSTTTAKPSGQPLITVEAGTGSAAFEAIGMVIRSLPASIRGQVTAVTASTPDDVTLTLGGTRTTIVWGSADQSAMKSVVLETMMKRRPPKDVSQYDVSSPEAIVVR